MENKRGIMGLPAWGWCVFDWANSAFPTVIVTFVFSAYFTQKVAVNATQGTAQWGHAMALAGLVVGLFSPLLGAIADESGRRKPWLAWFTLICSLACALLWFVRPQESDVFFALALVFLGFLGFEFGMVFYNAMLPDLVAPGHIGRLSGWGWGFGYAGGLAALCAALVFAMEVFPLDALNNIPAASVRISGPLVALWIALFSIPLFIFTPDRPATSIRFSDAVRRGTKTLFSTLRNVRDYASVARFLLAHLFYQEGLNTLFAFGGIYAAGSFGMTLQEVIYFGIAMNITAGLGAWAFAWVDDRLGPKRTILFALLALTILGAGLLFVRSQAWFWALALPLGIFVGPAQAASRSFMARLAPQSLRTEMFGLFAFSGKAVSFLGPALLAWVTLGFDSQRAGMAVAFVFLLAGMILLLKVPSPPAVTKHPL